MRGSFEGEDVAVAAAGAAGVAAGAVGVVAAVVADAGVAFAGGALLTLAEFACENKMESP